MNYLLVTIQIVISIAMSILILLQSKGGGLGSAFGNVQYQRTRRGADKVMFQMTIVLAVLFLTVSMASVLIS